MRILIYLQKKGLKSIVMIRRSNKHTALNKHYKDRISYMYYKEMREVLDRRIPEVLNMPEYFENKLTYNVCSIGDKDIPIYGYYELLEHLFIGLITGKIKDNALLERTLDFIEDMANSADDDVSNLLRVQILEGLFGLERDIFINMEKMLRPKTKENLEIVKTGFFEPNGYVPKNTNSQNKKEKRKRLRKEYKGKQINEAYTCEIMAIKGFLNCDGFQSLLTELKNHNIDIVATDRRDEPILIELLLDHLKQRQYVLYGIDCVLPREEESVEWLLSLLDNNAENLKYILARDKFNETVEIIEEYPLGEESDEDDAPDIDKVLGYSETSIADFIVELDMIKNHPTQLADYYKKIRIPRATNFASDIKRLYTDTFK